MAIKRVVPNLQTTKPKENRNFYHAFLGFDIVMDMEWIITFAAPTQPTAQLSVITSDATAPVLADVSIEVDNVDELYVEAIRRNLTIIYPLTDEPWGVRRFFVVDPNGKVVNLVAHLA